MCMMDPSTFTLDATGSLFFNLNAEFKIVEVV